MSWLPRNRILVPIDFSESSLAAIDTARELAPEDSLIHLVHVLEALHPVDPALVWEVVDEGVRREQVRKALVERLGSDPETLGYRLHLPVGSPGPSIAAVAEEEDIDLIVIPSHGRGGFKRLLLGSVTERVLRLAHCPVLVLRMLPGEED